MRPVTTVSFFSVKISELLPIHGIIRDDVWYMKSLITKSHVTTVINTTSGALQVLSLIALFTQFALYAEYLFLSPMMPWSGESSEILTEKKQYYGC